MSIKSSNEYISKIFISTKSWSALEKMLKEHLRTNNFIYCKSLKRKVFFDKLPEAILWRKSSAPQRLIKVLCIFRYTKACKRVYGREYCLI